MKTYLALLRGINVGGHNKILMKDLKKIFEDQGFKDVKTYIQRGNVIFKSKNKEAETLENSISKCINDKYGYNIPVLVKTTNQIKMVLDQCPFTEDKKEASYFMLMKNSPLEEDVKQIQLLSNPNEEFIIKNQCIYIFYAKGYSNAKYTYNFFDKKLKVMTTARNYRTLTKLKEILDSD